MRGEGDVRQKLKQAQYRHVKRILRRRFPRGGDWPKQEVEEIKDEYRAFFRDAPLHEIARDFPDVAALVWVLEDQPDQALTVNGTLVGRMGGVILWADTDDEAERARIMIDQIVEAATLTKEERDAHTCSVVLGLKPPQPKKSWWQRLFG